ncbi:hypothetical protein [Pseudomonas putida]|uniref:hypothetical protein n=1 Tax=Pseudomonas putida TaxID=303 RepID=UPI00062AF634|nr:hypothetical protein [Pseudomonas putida]KKX62375.1 hypothetical protein PU99_13060 [Pseudomonas putida]
MAGMKDSYGVTAEQPAPPWSSLAVLAKADGRHDLVADPDPVLKFGRSHYAFWTDLSSGYRSNEVQLACVPTAAESKSAIKWLKSIPRMLLTVRSTQRFAGGSDRIDILQCVDWRVFDHLLAGNLALPHQVIAQELQPKLLTVMAQHFSFQICNFDYPFSPYNGGKAYLLLQADTSALPDLESEAWMAVWDWRAEGNKCQASWTVLANLAQNELLAASFFIDHKVIVTILRQFSRALLCLNPCPSWTASIEWLGSTTERVASLLAECAPVYLNGQFGVLPNWMRPGPQFLPALP